MPYAIGRPRTDFDRRLADGLRRAHEERSRLFLRVLFGRRARSLG